MNKKRYWLRGGIIGGVVVIVIILIIILSSNFILEFGSRNCGGDVCNITPGTSFLLLIVALSLWPASFFRSLSVQNELQIYIPKADIFDYLRH